MNYSDHQPQSNNYFENNNFEKIDYLDYGTSNVIITTTNNSDNNSNLSATLHNIRALFNPENYSPSYRATIQRRTTLIIAFYCSIVIISLFGNLLVCYVVFKRKRMRISTNLLMTNLALSDLMMTVINIPFNIARILLDEWPFGPFLCIVVPLIQVTSVYVSTLTMTVIAIDRYQAIINPLHKRISTSLPTIVTIILIWLAAVLFSIPNVMFNRVVEIAGHTNLHRCRAIYPAPSLMYRRYVTLFTFLTQYAIPLSITTFAYIRIGFYIWSKLTEPNNNNNNNNNTIDKTMNEIPVPNKSNDSLENSVPSYTPNKLMNCYQNSINQLRERSRRKSIKMLALVVGVFSICWLPLNIFHLNSDFSSSNRISDPDIFFACHWFAMSSVCYNPFIYFWLNRHYRQEIKHLILCTKLVFSSRKHRGSNPMVDIMIQQDHEAHNNSNNHNRPKDYSVVFPNNNAMLGKDCRAAIMAEQQHNNNKIQQKTFNSNNQNCISCKIVFRSRYCNNNNNSNPNMATVSSDPIN